MYFRQARLLLTSLFLLPGIYASLPLLPAQATDSPNIQEFAAPARDETLKDIVASPDGTLWISMNNTNTIEHFNPKTSQFRTYHIFTATSYPESIATDASGNLWFSCRGDTNTQPITIGRISAQNGIISRYAPLEEKDIPRYLTRGVDGNIWYVTTLGTIERVTNKETFTEFSQVNSDFFGGIHSLTAGPDGKMWFINGEGSIVSLTLLGHFTGYPIQNITYRNLLSGLVTGPDGNLWFLTSTNTVWRVTPQGQMTQFPVPTTYNTANWKGLSSAGGRLWSTDATSHQLVSMTMQGTFTPYPLPTTASNPGAITAGPDASLWFADVAESKIWHFTPPEASHPQMAKNLAGFQEFSVPEPSIAPGIIVAGTKGNLWFSELQTTNIGRITTDGLFHEQYSTSLTYRYSGTLTGLAAGKDGNLWFPYEYNKIGRLKPDGKLDLFALQDTDNGTYSLSLSHVDGKIWFLSGIFSYGFITPQGLMHDVGIPHNSVAYGKDDITHLAAGPDGNLWITEPDQNLIGRLTPHSQITEYSIPSAPLEANGRTSSLPTLITGGPDGNVWFLESNGNRVGRITPTGVITEFRVQAPLINASAITFGADGNLWIAIQNTLVRVTEKGKESDFPLASDSYVTGITAGPDGNIWFTESGSGKIGRLLLK